MIFEGNLQVRWKRRRRDSLSLVGYHLCSLVTWAVVQIHRSKSCCQPGGVWKLICDSMPLYMLYIHTVQWNFMYTKDIYKHAEKLPFEA